MFTKSQIEQFLFFDVETAGSVSSYDELSPRMQELWDHRAEYLRSDRYPENQNKSNAELFEQKSALQAEFGRVVCVSFGKVKFPEETPDKPIVQIASYSGEDEVDLLTKAFKVMNVMHKNKNKLFGHNIKRFDIPYLCKRAFICKMDPALPLQVWDKKPWEIEVKDSSELWSFGAWQEGFTSLDLLTASLGLNSPKSDMQGDQVHSEFYAGNIGDIQTYCQRDVIALISVAFSLAGLNQFEESDIIFK